MTLLLWLAKAIALSAAWVSITDQCRILSLLLHHIVADAR